MLGDPFAASDNCKFLVSYRCEGFMIVGTLRRSLAKRVTAWSGKAL
jgi:hypothetical protein